jgi:ubiquinone/menaquinone biosynthesis C-methylase UbiE
MYPPAEQWKRHLWQATRSIRGKSEERTPLSDCDEAGRQRFYEHGSRELQNIIERIESQTGVAIDSCRALDYGCGAGRLAVPLAMRCEHVYGMDVSSAALREADRSARSMDLSNVEWMDVDRLSEMSGRYDLLISFYVFQHIRTRAGEEAFATLLRGLLPGGVGAVQFTISSPPFALNRNYLYSLGKSYSLDRLGTLLADQGIREWHPRLQRHGQADGSRSAYYDVSIVFRKPKQPSKSNGQAAPHIALHALG